MSGKRLKVPIAAPLPPGHDPGNHGAAPEEEDQKGSRKKTANMRPPRRPPKALEIHNPREKLEQKPKAQNITAGTSTSWRKNQMGTRVRMRDHGKRTK
jgi:hypothetical protein